MTDEQLYNYEMTFNVTRKTFDRPPPSVTARKEPHVAPRAAPKKTFDAPRYTAQPAETSQAAQTKAPEAEAPEAEVHEFEAPQAEAASQHAAPAKQEPLTAPAIEPAVQLDFSKPVRTITTKQPVEILTTRARHPVYKVHGYIADNEVVTVFTLDGRLSENGPHFLENVPQKQQLHLNIYRNREGRAEQKYLVTEHHSRSDADASAQEGRLACIAVWIDT
jgi:hypothetical protein